jgi:hypothetical protein
MKTCLSIALACCTVTTVACSAAAGELTLESAPPVVVATLPCAGAQNVDPAITEIKATFSKDMQDGSWSWSTWEEENFPEVSGKIHYLSDRRTCVLPVKLKPGSFYALWLNSEKFKNFTDTVRRPAVPYLLTFRTAEAGGAPPPAAAALAPVGTPGLNDDQSAVERWTDRQFRSFFDRRTFASWTPQEVTELENRLIDSLKGPHSQEYYRAINSLGALRSNKAVPVLLAIASERVEKDNRDRWMAIRALGLIGDKTVVPDLIHLVYHGNSNTRWWAQISLVRLTGVNYGNDWKAWGTWWTSAGGQPPFDPEFVRWYKDPNFSDPEKIMETLNENDRKFLESIRQKS